jgi:oxygen-independent coproporphyrinogen-3 oxidase
MANVVTDLGNYISKELGRDPGICILTYPYSFAWGEVSKDDVNNAWAMVSRMPNSFLYVNIPFCANECHFCGFYKLTGQPYSRIKAYLDDLFTEMEIAAPLLYGKKQLAATIGGGTPSLLKANELSMLLSKLTKTFDLDPDCEITVEVYPGSSATVEKFTAMKKSGANRISLGFQSLNDEMKRNCNRSDTVQQNLAAYRYARDVGFEQISIDLLCGLPNQTLEVWQDTVRRSIDLAPDQICFFPVSIRHPGIPFYEKVKQELPAFEILKTMYFWAREELIASGYQQVTRHNFKKPHHRGLYEYHQSLGTPGLGLGANSISYLPGMIYKNVRDLNGYSQAIHKAELPIEDGFDLVKNHEDANAFVVKRLTFLEVDKSEFRTRFQKNFDETYPEQIKALTQAGLVSDSSEKLRLTELGTYYTALVKRCFFSKRLHQLQTERLGRLNPPQREASPG